MSNFQSPLLQNLLQRGLIKDISNSHILDQTLVRGEKIAIYCGFDPTADSLHVGHLVSLSLMRAFAKAGHNVIPVVGTATALIGDPSGRKSARPMMEPSTLKVNSERLQSFLREHLGDQNITLRSNGDWIESQSLLGFLREVGAHIPLSRILALESVRSRLGNEEGGPSFLETSYALLQGFDFYHLNQEFSNLLQIGGSDQWGNICMGLELIARKGKKNNSWGMTHPLLLNSLGEKMGKTAGGAIWLAADRLSAFDFFQFWRTMNDSDFLKTKPLLSEQESFADVPANVAELEKAKELFALEMTSRVRGVKAAISACEASRSKGQASDGLEPVEVDRELLEDMRALLVHVGLATSKGDATRLAAAGGVRVNGQKRMELQLSEEDLEAGCLVLSIGKTKHVAIKFPTREFKI